MYRLDVVCGCVCVINVYMYAYLHGVCSACMCMYALFFFVVFAIILKSFVYFLLWPIVVSLFGVRHLFMDEKTVWLVHI